MNIYSRTATVISTLVVPIHAPMAALPSTPPNHFEANAKISSSQVNENFDRVYSAVSAAAPIFKNGPGTSTLTVPPGATRALVEAIGGGGGGGGGAGGSPSGSGLNGGSGRYVKGFLDVTAGGTLSISIGDGGDGGSGSPNCLTTPAAVGSPGVPTVVSTASAQITAGSGSGGGGATYSMGCFAFGASNGTPTSGSVFFSVVIDTPTGTAVSGAGGDAGTNAGTAGLKGKPGMVLISFY